MQRRQLDFHSGNEVIEEIDRLRSGGYDRAGNWSLTQVCDHLDKTMRGGMEGFDFRLPWVLRATLGKYLVGKMLRTRRVGRFPAPKAVIPQSESGPEDDETIDRCKETIRQSTGFAGPLPPHPAVNAMSVEDWKDLMWIHASHHLGFLIPRK